MSLIVNSPIALPVVAKDVPTPISGTRGLVAKYDGWYDYQSDGTETKILSANDDISLADEKKITLRSAESGDTGTNVIDAASMTVEYNNMKTAIGCSTARFSFTDTNKNVFIQPENVTINQGGKTVHALSSKANTSDVFLKSDDVVLAKDKIIKVIKDGESTVYDGSTENIQIRGDAIFIRANDVEPYGLTLRKNGITLEAANESGTTKTVSISPSDVTIIDPDSNGYQHKLTEKLSQGQLELYLINSDEKQFYGGISVTRNNDDADIKVIIPGNPNTGVETTVHKLSEKVDKSYVDGLVMESGGGDMLRTVYDKDKTGTVDDSKKLGGQLPSYYAKASDLAEKWTGKVYTVEVGNDWEIHTVTSNGEEKLGSYYQEIAVEGITSVGQPFVDVVLPDDDAQAKQQLTDYQCVSRVKTENGKIILKCFEDRPSSSFTIRVLVLGNVL